MVKVFHTSENIEKRGVLPGQFIQVNQDHPQTSTKMERATTIVAIVAKL